MNKIFVAFSIGLSISLAAHGGTNELNLEKHGELKLFAATSRNTASVEGFEAFRESVFKENFPGGVYIVNGDTPVISDAQLYKFYLQEIQQEWPSSDFGIKLTVDAPNGVVAKWDAVDRKNLTYCVSTSFGDRYQNVVEEMRLSTIEWMNASDVRFVHISREDIQCNQNNTNVMFDVRPINVGGEYLARAFFPRYPRATRNLLIDRSAFGLDPRKPLSLRGILRHEIGHTLGFRHEHTRPESGACFEDPDWQPLGNYDAFSVMHYPQCNGFGDWSLSLTQADKNGAACLYGRADGIPLGATDCPRT